MRIFELATALRYLVPRRSHLSQSIVALLSVGIIALVVWLLTLFLSITEGIEREWHGKLTSLHAPIQITPTEKYYSSYYYQVDSLAEASSYTFKTLREKKNALSTDPYDASIDLALPPYVDPPVLNKNGSLKDLVKDTFSAVQQLRLPGLHVEEYEIGGALMHLRFTSQTQESAVLTQISCLRSLSENCPPQNKLLQPLSKGDLNHLIRIEKEKILQKNTKVEAQNSIAAILANVNLEKLQSTGSHWALPPSLLPSDSTFSFRPYVEDGRLVALFASLKPTSEMALVRKGKDGRLFIDNNGKTEPLSEDVPLLVEGPVAMDVCGIDGALVDVSFTLQGRRIRGPISFERVEIVKANAKNAFLKPPPIPPPWAYTVRNTLCLPKTRGEPVLLPRTCTTSDVGHVGDGGTLNYQALTPSGQQEMQLPFSVVGFYNPGILTVGPKSLLMSSQTIERMKNNSRFLPLTPLQTTGIAVWFDGIEKTREVKEKIVSVLEKDNLSSFWNVTAFYEYDFAKDLLQQFQSDRYLFTLVAILILCVGCSNILSLLILLVKDKQKEIGILQAMGASKKTILTIFATCGFTMGCAGAVIGLTLALVSLHYLEHLVAFLSFLKGHELFNSTFYGQQLPNTLSPFALKLLIFATPTLAILAALVPAYKACRLSPAAILKGEER